MISLNSVLSLLRYRSSHPRCSEKISVLKNFANFTEKTPVRSLFLIKFQAGLKACNFIKETPAQAFSYEVCEIFKNTYFEEHLRATASEE